MNLTEDEAKQRWCPFAQVGFGTRMPGTFNRLQITDQNAGGQTVEGGKVIIPAGARCIGSQCMAWRFADQNRRAYPFIVALPGKEPERYAWDPTGHEGYADVVVTIAPPDASTGYCGLAR